MNLSPFAGSPTEDEYSLTLDMMHALAAALHVKPSDNLDEFVARLEAAMATVAPQRIVDILSEHGRSRARGGDLIVGTRPGEAPYDYASTKHWLCGKCGLIINRFATPDGASTFVHARSWLKHDHEPEPVEAADTDVQPVRDCDFCSRFSNINWRYTGEHIRYQPPGSNTLSDYGTIWAGCDDCDQYIRMGDVEGLIEHVLQVGPRMSTYPPSVKEVMRERFRDLHGVFVPSIYKRERVTPIPPPPSLHPRQMPKLRDGLVKHWRAGQQYANFHRSTSTMSLPGFAYSADDKFRVTRPGPQIPEDAYRTFADHIASGLEVADLYYVSRDFTHLAITSGQELTDVSLTREELPSAFGFLVWEEPIEEAERIMGFKAGFRSVSWTLVPGGVWVNFYVQPEDGDPDYRYREPALSKLIALSPGTGLPFINLGPVPEEPQSGLLTTLLATWFLMTQPGVGQETIQHADKGLQRAYKRAGRKTPDVRVIDLRRRSQAERDAAAAAGEIRKISVRFLVRGHWKRQAYGPARSLRKTIYVAPFMKGPDGAPLKIDIPTVKVLR